MQDVRRDLFIGIDPDLHKTGIAAIVKNDDGAPLLLKTFVAEVQRRSVGLDACARMAHEIILRLDEAFSDYWWRQCGDFSRVFLVAEGQQKYMGEGAKRSNPEDLIRLAHVSGAAVAWDAPGQYRSTMGRRIVIPSKWKGQVPKDICQSRAFTRLGLTFEKKDAGYCVPCNHAGEILHGHAAGEWKHVGDAVALALWAFREIHENPIRDTLESEWHLTP